MAPSRVPHFGGKSFEGASCLPAHAPWWVRMARHGAPPNAPAGYPKHAVAFCHGVVGSSTESSSMPFFQGRQQVRKLPNPDTWRRTSAKAFAKDVFINQERKLGARRRSDTVLVSTINDADQGSADVAFRTPLAPYEKSKSFGSGGSMVARLKLKGIDGRAPPGVEPAA
ncbi:unnamed protein product [Lupinus luteus]|uniref:Uncharacterized protein n=1 Tax=Lupinus luteus TaxID=3873 RepID=A0AAV1VYG2_LUPLU